MAAQLPPVYCSSSTRIAHLTALREVAITDIADPRYRCSFDADGEPSLLAVADHGLAMAWGNKVGPVPARCWVCAARMSACLHVCAEPTWEPQEETCQIPSVGSISK